MSDTIWVASPVAPSRVTCCPPVYSASCFWQPAVVKPSAQGIPVGLYVTNDRFVFACRSAVSVG